MKHLSFSFETSVTFDEPVTEHAFVLRCLPVSAGPQTVKSYLSLEPQCSYALQQDSFGNRLAVGRIAEEHSQFSYQSYGFASVDATKAWRDEAHPMYRFASPLATPDAQLRSWVEGLGLERGADGALSQAGCIALMHAVNAHMAYEPHSTDVGTSASQAFAQARGVCQDFAHVLVAAFRACGMAARYVSGLTLGEGETHAWVHVHVGGTWLALDPTCDCLAGEDYIVCTWGRDWADCPIERGTMHGQTDQQQRVLVHVEEQASA